MSLDAAGRSACATSSFDTVASSYDRQWTDTPNGRAQREQVWRHLDPLFHPGDRILDIGCGTGADAAHFSSRGILVHAVDPSSAMIEIARERGGFTTEVLAAEEIGRIGGTFDGAISNFGALNCVPDLRETGRELAALIRPGGHLAICIIGRFCAWESLHYAVRGQFAKAIRRLRGSAGSSLGVTVHFPTVATVRAAFPDFTISEWTGIGLIVPPSYVRLPERMVRWAAWLDRAFAHLPMFRAMADHRLLILVRK
jgi:ubiquinone/menaquinone biosynthesis C-methylase UbiE